MIIAAQMIERTWAAGIDVAPMSNWIGWLPIVICAAIAVGVGLWALWQVNADTERAREELLRHVKRINDEEDARTVEAANRINGRDLL